MLLFLWSGCASQGGIVRQAPSAEIGDSDSITSESEPLESESLDSEPPGPCPADMTPVDDVCMDTYEAPNVAGSLPLVMYTMLDAEEWCQARDKRLCFDDEWQEACEGPDGWAYPYGPDHQPGVCNDEETWRLYDQSLLNGWPSSASWDGIDSLDALWDAASSAPATVEHLRWLYQGEGGGTNTGCGGTYGVFDLVGNVEEWTRRSDGGTPDFHGSLKGRYWAESRTCQSGVTTHGDAFRFYEIGFRCCREPNE